MENFLKNVNPLPENIDWKEINAYLLKDKETAKVLYPKLSKTSQEVLRCLKSDINLCWEILGVASGNKLITEMTRLSSSLRDKYFGLPDEYIRYITHRWGMYFR